MEPEPRQKPNRAVSKSKLFDVEIEYKTLAVITVKAASESSAKRKAVKELVRDSPDATPINIHARLSDGE